MSSATRQPFCPGLNVLTVLLVSVSIVCKGVGYGPSHLTIQMPSEWSSVVTLLDKLFGGDTHKKLYKHGILWIKYLPSIFKFCQNNCLSISTVKGSDEIVSDRRL